MRKHLAEFFADQGHGTGRQGEGKEKEDLCFPLTSLTQPLLKHQNIPYLRPPDFLIRKVFPDPLDDPGIQKPLRQGCVGICMDTSHIAKAGRRNRQTGA